MENSIFTEKNLTKALMLLALPSMFGQLTTLIYNLAETYFVSLTKDPDQIAAVTLGAPVLLIIMSIASIFGAGGSSVIARLLGQQNEKKAREIANYCVFTMLLVSIGVAVAGSLLLPQIVTILGADAQNAAYTIQYLRYILYGAPLIMFSNGMLHIFRSAGLIRQGTTGLMIGNVANVIFCFIYIVVLGMGTAGASLAAVTGFFLNTLYFISCMIRLQRNNHSVFRISPKSYHPTRETTKQVFSIGIPGALVTVLMSIVSIILNNFIGKYGSASIASYGIAYKILLVAVMLSVGLAQGVVPLIGYCYGANEKRRLKKAMYLSMSYCFGLGLLFTVLFLLFSRQLTMLFLNQESLVRLSGDFLMILCVFLPMMGITNMVTGYYQATGKSLPSLFITCCKNVVIFLPSVILLNHLFGRTGVIAAQPVVEILISLVCILMFRADLKKYMEITPHEQNNSVL